MVVWCWFCCVMLLLLWVVMVGSFVCLCCFMIICCYFLIVLGVIVFVCLVSVCDFYSSYLCIWYLWMCVICVDVDIVRLCMCFDEVQKIDCLIGVEIFVVVGVCFVGLGVFEGGVGLLLLICEGEELVLIEDGLYIELLDLQQLLQIGCSYLL